MTSLIDEMSRRAAHTGISGPGSSVLHGVAIALIILLLAEEQLMAAAMDPRVPWLGGILRPLLSLFSRRRTCELPVEPSEERPAEPERGHRPSVRPITDQEGRRILQMARSSTDPGRLRRAIVVLASAQDRPVHDICELLELPETFVLDVIRDFNERGMTIFEPSAGPASVSPGGLAGARSVEDADGSASPAAPAASVDPATGRVLDLYAAPTHTARVLCVEEIQRFDLGSSPRWPSTDDTGSESPDNVASPGAVRNVFACLDLETGLITWRTRRRNRWRELPPFLYMLRKRYEGRLCIVLNGFRPISEDVRDWAHAHDVELVLLTYPAGWLNRIEGELAAARHSVLFDSAPDVDRNTAVTSYLRSRNARLRARIRRGTLPGEVSDEPVMPKDEVETTQRVRVMMLRTVTAPLLIMFAVIIGRRIASFAS